MADLSPTERPTPQNLSDAFGRTIGEVAWITHGHLPGYINVRLSPSDAARLIAFLAAQSAPTTQPADDRHANLRRVLADYDEARLLGPPHHTTRSNVIDAVRELLGDDT